MYCDSPLALFEVNYDPGADRTQKQCRVAVIKPLSREGRVGEGRERGRGGKPRS